jgi:hypothetical protein
LHSNTSGPGRKERDLHSNNSGPGKKESDLYSNNSGPRRKKRDLHSNSSGPGGRGNDLLRTLMELKAGEGRAAFKLENSLHKTSAVSAGGK